MQNHILDYNFYKSASLLDNQRLWANVYENIHGLASLLGCNDKLYRLNKKTNKIEQLGKRSVANHPNIKRWDSWIPTYYRYIWIHIEEWLFNRRYQIGEITKNNLYLLMEYKVLYECWDDNVIPDWINDNLINKHKQILLKKNYEFYKNKF